LPSSISTLRAEGVPSSSTVIEPRRSSNGAVVDHRHAFRRDLRAEQAGEGRCLLAVEVAFQPVADRLVQHDARPAGRQHDVEGAGRGGDRREVDQRLPQRLIGDVFQFSSVRNSPKPLRPPMP
jgi:hypothetical protein